jgi:hypothetical protein
MTDDKFNKEYRYNIRHAYGLEGKRQNYAARRWVHINSGSLFMRRPETPLLCTAAIPLSAITDLDPAMLMGVLIATFRQKSCVPRSTTFMELDSSQMIWKKSSERLGGSIIMLLARAPLKSRMVGMALPMVTA